MSTPLGSANTQYSMARLIAALPTFARRYEVIMSLVDVDSHEDIEVADDVRELLDTWRRQAFVDILAGKRRHGTGDGSSMVDIAFEQFDFAFFQEV
jgi:hypothetical protein